MITCFTQAMLILRWLLDNTRITQLAIDHGVSRTTAYRYLHEGIVVARYVQQGETCGDLTRAG